MSTPRDILDEECQRTIKAFSLAEIHHKLNELNEMEIEKIKDIKPLVAKLGEILVYDIEFQNCLVHEYNRHVLVSRLAFSTIGFILGALTSAFLYHVGFGGV